MPDIFDAFDMFDIFDALADALTMGNSKASKLLNNK